MARKPVPEPDDAAEDIAPPPHDAPEEIDDAQPESAVPEPAPTPAAKSSASAGSADSHLSGKRIGIIGAGAMGSALCRGLVQGEAAPPGKIVVFDPHTAHTQHLQQSLGVKAAATNVQIAKYTDIIILCVKPYNVGPVIEEINESLKRDDGKPLPLIISIAAGTRIEAIESRLLAPLPVIRAMPNTPAQVGLGAAAYCAGTHATDAHKAQAAAIFESVGVAVEVAEPLMDAVTALSGSGPAYVYLMIEALVDGGVKVGLPRDVASQLAAQTVLGAARMVIETGMHPAQLRDMVATPGGTTITAISALEHSGVRAALIDAVEKATNRSRELG